jgi:hypothetical protein
VTESGWTPLTREEAIAEGWKFYDNGSGTITRACDDWIWTYNEIRGFLHQTQQWSTDRAEAADARTKGMQFSDDGPDWETVFSSQYGTVMPHQHEYLLLSAVIRDAVSAYEVYLTQALDEVLNRQRSPRKSPDDTPRWGEFRTFYGVLGLDPRPEKINVLIRLRDILTHRRGELRTQEHRKLFAATADGPFGSTLADLTEHGVIDFMVTLHETVQDLDPVLWAYSSRKLSVPAWDQRRDPDLAADSLFAEFAPLL